MFLEEAANQQKMGDSPTLTLYHLADSAIKAAMGEPWLGSRTSALSRDLANRTPV
jgi:hypothetical protein